MKNLLFIIALVTLVITSCNRNTPEKKITQVGEAIDSTAIAQDTLMQQAIENTYEYSKTLTVNEKLVFDVLGYGKAAKGEYIIIRRGADNKPDTLLREPRAGMIVNSWTSDMNQNGEPEVLVLTKSTGEIKNEALYAFEIQKNGKAEELKVPADKCDTAYYLPKANALAIRIISGEGPEGITYHYKLKGNKFAIFQADVE